MNRRSFLMVAGAGILVVGLGAAFVQRDRLLAVAGSSPITPDPARSSTPLPVSTVLAGEIIPPTFQPSYAGVLVARYESELGFERGGRVVKVLVEEGDSVNKGDELCSLDVSDLDATERRTRAELAAAEALLQERVSGPRQQTIDAAKAKVAALKANLDLALADLNRERRLTQRGAGTGRALDKAAFSEQSMREDLKAAQAELALLQEGTRAEQITSQKAVCESIRGRLAEVEAMRQDSLIVAPFAGRIGSRMVDPGAVLATADPVFRLLSDQLEGRFGVPAEVAAGLTIDQSVEVSVNGKRRTAKVRRLEPMVDRATRTRGIFVELLDDKADNKAGGDGGWVAGQVARLHVSTPLQSDNTDDSFWVPVSALTRGGRGIWTLLVLPGSEQSAAAERRAVELLRTNGDFALVIGMVQRGERVVDAGRHRITAGMKLRDTSTTNERKVSAEPGL